MAGIEILFIGLIIFVILEANSVVDSNRFIKDNEEYVDFLQEKDYDFFVKSKYGDDVDVHELFMKRVKMGLAVIIVFFFMFISNINYLNIIITIAAGYFVFKMPYMKVKSFYQNHLHEIDMLLPYYLKSLEILVQHYTVPVALGKSMADAPDMFKPGLETLINKINSGDSTVEPYMDFAKQYPVRDSMRMMRLLYRLSLGSGEHKQEQLLMFARNISSLQTKSRDTKYKNRLHKMENMTMVMLVVTGGAGMLLMLLSLVITFTSL